MFFVGLVVGMVIGWNVLPQPKFVSDFIEKIKAKFTKTSV